MSSPIQILAVDDRPENLVALEAILQDTDHKLVCALSGPEALELSLRHDFALILLDMQMPIMNGIETARRLRENEKTRSTPLIFVSAIHRTDEYEKLGYIAGAVDFLFKPLNAEILKAKIEVFAELHRRTEENRRQAELLQAAALREQEITLLRQAMHSRDEFLAMAAHELKTPITPLNLQMQMFIQMYEDGSIQQIPVERLLRMLKTSQAQIDRLSRLIFDLVEVTRLNSGRIELKRESVCLRELTESALTSFSDVAKKAGCDLTLESQGEISGHWDRFRLEQVIINLFTNACKFGAGKPIRMRLCTQGDKALFSIRDQGIGIDSKDHQRIFGRFERAVSGRNYAGLGLGLFIAGEIIRLHGGLIRVDSRLGQGAEFTFELPLA